MDDNKAGRKREKMLMLRVTVMMDGMEGMKEQPKTDSGGTDTTNIERIRTPFRDDNFVVGDDGGECECGGDGGDDGESDEELSEVGRGRGTKRCMRFQIYQSKRSTSRRRSGGVERQDKEATEAQKGGRNGEKRKGR